MFYLLLLIWQDLNIPVVTICFSLSSASPAHTPKEEYVITQSTDTTQEEPVHDQTEDQGEPQEDRSEPTERKSVPGGFGCRGRLVKPEMNTTHKSSMASFSVSLCSFQMRCCSVDCVPPLVMMGRRKKRPGRSSWMPTRSSWRRRCRKPGGWFSAYR